MINVKDQIYNALLKVTENVTDSYPADDESWAKLPVIIYCEEDNKVVEWTDEKEDKSYLRYRIEIYDKQSTSLTALAVDNAISSLGLKRCLCQDANEPGWKHKVMRYEGIIDVESQYVYQN